MYTPYIRAGEFVKGQVEGVGHETYADGSTYKGQFYNGSRHGLGVFAMPSGEKYSGWWDVGERNGLGLFTLASRVHGVRVLGDFLNGEFQVCM